MAVPSLNLSASESVAKSTDDVYLRLREAIVEGELRPNERLIETELAERLGVSRTPIREAMQRLAGDGLIRSRARGWAVHEHDAEEIRQIYEARMALEGFSAYLAAERASDQQLSEIERIHSESIAHARKGDLREVLVALNERFHSAVFEASANHRITELIAKNRDFYFNHRIASAYTVEEMEASLTSQGAIVKALLKRNARSAELAARKHVEQALGVILSKVR
jgi:DNA-binding GntR family transcriptional regulator